LSRPASRLGTWAVRKAAATQAITLFYKQVELREGLPFVVAIPSATTKRTFQLTDGGRDLVICEDADDMFRRLGI
jgi:DNA-damage-inducible protein J